MKKYRVLVLLALLFLLPVGLAKLILDKQWYTGGVTNQGQLVTPPLQAQWLAKAETWQLIYWLPEHCHKQCEAALFHLKQVPIAVGAYQERVKSQVLLAPHRQVTIPIGLSYYHSDKAQASLFDKTRFGFNALYIVDPLGNVMMAYPLETEQKAIVAQGKGILKDLKRLLKVSKIG